MICEEKDMMTIGGASMMGDTFFPDNLRIKQFPAFQSSIDKKTDVDPLSLTFTSFLSPNNQ